MLDKIKDALSGSGLSKDIVDILLSPSPSATKDKEVTKAPTQGAPTGGIDLKGLMGHLSNAVDQTPGKGMDDDVPATINGDQPAALSEGEFVWPADVVSLLGDGNTEAGAKVLQAFMDHIRKEKTGTKDQPKKISEIAQS